MRSRCTSSNLRVSHRKRELELELELELVVLSEFLKPSTHYIESSNCDFPIPSSVQLFPDQFSLTDYHCYRYCHHVSRLV